MRELMWGLFDIWNVIQDMIWQISVVILVVIVCRFFVQKVSKQACYLLWLVVAVRLICPVTISSELSIFNVVGNMEKPSAQITLQEQNIVQNDETIFEATSQEQIVIDNVQAEGMQIATAPEVLVTNEEILFIDNKNATQTDKVIPDEPIDTTSKKENVLSGISKSVDTKLIDANVTFAIWLLGIALMILYGAGSYVHLKHKLRFATKVTDDYFESDVIHSPFVFGVFKPLIYMPCHLNEMERNYILLHERYHIRRRDYLIKLLAFGLLAVYWFHPLVWIAFYLMSQDMEMSCDEQVLKELGLEERKAYSTLLLSFASGKRIPLPSPLSFGENNVKSRIKQILNYKKPTIHALIVMAGLVILVVISCLTDARDDSDNTDNDTISAEQKYEEASGRLSDAYLNELAIKLYEVKNAYIGDVPANGKIINYLKEALEITNTYGVELQTVQEPYWLTLDFDEKPDDEAMFHMATMFIALVDNASEFRWEFQHEISNEVCVYYVNEKLVNLLLKDSIQAEKGIKDYTDSPESIVELWRLLDDIKEQYDSTNGQSELVKESNWEYFAQSFGFDFSEANDWENRFIKDNLLYNTTEDAPFSIRDITSCIYKDFDENGQMDMAVLVSGYFGTEYGSRLYLYMNEEPGYYARGFMDKCYGMDIQTGDVDHDGYLEFVFIGGSGGNGGAGSYCKDLFKYKDGTFYDMPIPGDYDEYNMEWPTVKEMGYELEVCWGEEMDTYDIFCPALGVTKTVYSPYLGDENGELYNKPQPGVLVGGNCRGFHTLKIVEIDGKEYLVGTEVVTGDGGTVNCFANARFVLDWNEEGWFVKDFDVISYDYEDDTEAVFETMKQALEYQPTSYEAIIDEHIPLIDYTKNEIIDSYNWLSNFAHCGYYGYNQGITYVAWNANEEPIYVRILLKDGIYYYLEGLSDYGYATYTNEIYSVKKAKTGEYIECFYLTNEMDLTLEELEESLLSSATPSSYDVTPIYHRALDEDGFSEYMEVTGNIPDLETQILFPDINSIQEPKYSVQKEASFQKPLAKVTYYDRKIFSDMTLLIGSEEDVWNNTDITAYIDNFTAEQYRALTADHKEINVAFYVVPIDDIYKMTAATWIYEDNTYLLYGKTAAGDCSVAVEIPLYIVEHLGLNGESTSIFEAFAILKQDERWLKNEGYAYETIDSEIRNCIYNDFDNSGTLDLILHIVTENDSKSMLHIFMNEDFYTVRCPQKCWDIEVLSGDIDHDGAIELIYSGDTGGNGGSGSYCKGIIKYVNHSFSIMDLPGDFSQEEKDTGEYGYHIDAYFGTNINEYEIVCPTLNKRDVIQHEYAKDAKGNYFRRGRPGEQAGGNVRGFYNLSIQTENGKDYLAADEYLHGEGGINWGIGTVHFVFDWDETVGWFVKDYEIEVF